MKTLLFSGFTLIAGLLLLGCGPSSETAPPASSCRIQQVVSTTKSRFYTATNQTTYTYDPTGNLISSVVTFDKQPAAGAIGTQTGTTTTTYQYDADGYLTRSTVDQQNRITLGTDGKVISEQISDDSRFTYTNGRLTRKAVTYSGTYISSATPTISTYEYDAAGNLTRIRTSRQGNETNQSISVYTANQLVDYIAQSGTGEQRPYTIQNGLVSKLVTPGANETLTLLSQYDAQQRQVLVEEYKNEQLTQRTEQTWTDAKPATASLPTFRGFPALRPADPVTGQHGVLSTQKKANWNSVSKTMQPFSEQTSVVQTNTQGYVSAVTTTVKHATATDQDYTTTETYTYIGCQTGSK